MKLFKSIAIVIAMLMVISTVSFNQVVEVDAAAMKLNYSKKDLQVKKSFTLKVKNAKKKKIKWSSSKKKIAKVSKKGKVTGLKEGKAIITAKIGKKKLKCTVTVMTKAQLNAAKAAKNTKPVTSNKNIATNNKTTNNKTTNKHSNKNNEALKCLNEFEDRSKQRSKEELADLGFTESEIKYAMEHCTVDWKDHAKKRAENYLEWFGEYVFTREKMMNWLKEDEFTDSEIDYAIKNSNINWNEDAKKYLEEMVKKTKNSGFSRKELRERMLDVKYTESEMIYAVEQCKLNWNDLATQMVKYNYGELDSSSKNNIKESLKENEFTDTEISYALDHCGINWKKCALNYAKQLIDVGTRYKAEIKTVLENDCGFNSNEIAYVEENLSDHWKEMAYVYAKVCLAQDWKLSLDELTNKIENSNNDFTHEEAVFGAKKALSELQALYSHKYLKEAVKNILHNLFFVALRL